MLQRKKKARQGAAEVSRRGALQRYAGRAFLFQWLFISALVLASCVLWTDHVVRAQFEGRRWALPARVYGRPLEAYPGRSLSVEGLVKELDALGYRNVDRLSGPGQYVERRDAVSLVTRGFTFWDAVEPSRRVVARFNGPRLESLESNGGGSALVRIEPLEIARIYPHHNEDRVLVKLGDVPPILVRSLLAIEDKAFYQHFGIDPRGIVRALLENVRARSIRQGGSTLTQQLAKNFYLTRDRTVWRKLNEILIALILESRYSKDEILEAYLNEIYLGQDGAHAIHGFGLASQFYFGLPLSEIKTHQMALLASLARGASLYDPRRHPQRALQRRNRVLAEMIEEHIITPKEGRRLMSTALDVTPKPRFTGSRFPAFMDLVRRQLVRDYQEEDLRSEGLQIFTTLDPQLQLRSERVLATRIAVLEVQRRLAPADLQGAMITTGTDTGEVLALVGGRDPDYAGFNRVLDAKRQVGSIVKPAVYLAAMARPESYNLLTPLSDSPLRLQDRNGKDWVPQNYDKQFHGAVPLHAALANSYNLATVRLGMDLGLVEVRRTLKALGIDEEIPDYPSVLLGTIDLSPLQVAQMYQTLASGGFHIPLRAIREVSTQEGRPLRRYELAIRQAFRPAPIFLINYLLTQVVRSGTARDLGAQLPKAMPVAGKTGTTNELRDSWFAGFDSDRLTVVWLGRDGNQPAGLSGAAGAMRVWSDLMRELPPAPLHPTAPEDIAWCWIDSASGRRTDAGCPNANHYPFIAPHAPNDYQPCHDATEDVRLGTTLGPVR